MIAGNENEMMACLGEMRDTREALNGLKDECASQYQVNRTAYITSAELKTVLQSRLARLEAHAFELGIYGPGARDNAKASAMALIHSNNPRPTQ